jgi:hypothetical protein
VVIVKVLGKYHATLHKDKNFVFTSLSSTISFFSQVVIVLLLPFVPASHMIIVSYTFCRLKIFAFPNWIMHLTAIVVATII